MQPQAATRAQGEALLSNALAADRDGRFEEACRLYERGVEYYLSRVLNERNSSVQAYIRQNCAQHLNRAETLKDYINGQKSATSKLEDAMRAYTNKDYSTAYPSFLEGIEKLLECSRLIKPSHPKEYASILTVVDAQMVLAEEAKNMKNFGKGEESSQRSNDKCKTEASYSPTAPLLEEHHIQLSTDCMGSADNTSRIEADKLPNEQNEEGKKTAEDDSANVLIIKQRAEFFAEKSSLLLDHLMIDHNNSEKLQELADTSIQLSSILEEEDSSGRKIFEELSSFRENVDTLLERCFEFLASPRSSSVGRESVGSCIGSRECLVCLEGQAVMATIPCGHLILCEECVQNICDIKVCYMCKCELNGTKLIKIF